MRHISADYIYTVSNKILKKGIITIDDEGFITDIKDTKGKLKETEKLEYYNGIIVPGFVNAHCHLELSHMKGVLQCKKQGLPKFIEEIISKRFFPENLQDYIKRADTEMLLNGIVAVGDISNTDDSFEVKRNSKINYYTFIEAFTTENSNIEDTFAGSLKNFDILNGKNLSANIVPHAPYSVPDKLFEKIYNFNSENKGILSIHNQETESENMLFISQTGDLYETLSKIGFKYREYSFNGTNSLQTTLKKLYKNQNILLIHNTYTSKEDIEFAENFSGKIYWVFCPNSNLYIEDNLPKLDLFLKKNIKTCIGTDSYSSNEKLSILSEMKTICKNFPAIPFEKVLASATFNGAKALKLENTLGSFEIGKKPGINLIENFDLAGMKLANESKIRVLA